MELTVDQRSELLAMRDQGFGETYHRDLVRPGTKIRARTQRTRLLALSNAWSAIDPDTQMQLLVAMHTMSQDNRDDAPLPDLHTVVIEFLREMELPSGRPEDIPGLRDATALLWSAWCADRGPIVPIDRDALDAIGAELADLFAIPLTIVRRRAESVLRELDANDELPGRKGYAS